MSYLANVSLMVWCFERPLLQTAHLISPDILLSHFLQIHFVGSVHKSAELLSTFVVYLDALIFFTSLSHKVHLTKQCHKSDELHLLHILYVHLLSFTFNNILFSNVLCSLYFAWSNSIVKL